MSAFPLPTDNPPFGLLGRTLGHSWSPRIHALFGSAPYALFECEPEEVDRFVRTGSWHGINVTIPYKREAARIADECSDRVLRLGVANTLVRRDDGSIFADNTDVLGFSWMLERFCGQRLGLDAVAFLKGRKALVFGSGGASQAVQASLADVGTHVVVVSRTGDETYETVVERHADAVLAVNTTPVGMFPNCPASPVTDEQLRGLRGLKAVLDVVYNPERTGLCLAAERAGIPYESGLGMLVAQAWYSSALFQGHDLETTLIDEVERDLHMRNCNIVLIGMPGSGKSSAGRRLARMLKRPFADLDDCFAIDHGMRPAEHIVTYGEDAFRRLETQTAATYCSRSGLVIACGGGIVTRPENYDLIHQNAVIIMIDRPLDELSSDGRPLSQSLGIQRLADERMGLYRAWADHILRCTGSAAGDALAIRELLHM